MYHNVPAGGALCQYTGFSLALYFREISYGATAQPFKTYLRITHIRTQVLADKTILYILIQGIQESKHHFLPICSLQFCCLYRCGCFIPAHIVCNSLPACLHSYLKKNEQSYFRSRVSLCVNTGGQGPFDVVMAGGLPPQYYWIPRPLSCPGVLCWPFF